MSITDGEVRGCLRGRVQRGGADIALVLRPRDALTSRANRNIADRLGEDQGARVVGRGEQEHLLDVALTQDPIIKEALHELPDDGLVIGR